MATIIAKKPNNAIIGPNVIRRKEKISGLYSVAPLGLPTISAKPITTTTTLMAINTAFIFGRLNFIQLITPEPTPTSIRCPAWTTRK